MNRPAPTHLVVLVTGGSRGIGAAIASHLAERGHRVFATHRAAPRPARDGLPELLQLDVGDMAWARAAVQAVHERAGRLDALVNNAGFDLHGAMAETPSADFEDQLDTNFTGAARMIHAAR